jgi:hypothetical protein
VLEKGNGMIKVICYGGKADNRVYAIPDHVEGLELRRHTLDLSDTKTPIEEQIAFFETAYTGIEIYKRTDQVDENGFIIFMITGIDA